MKTALIVALCLLGFSDWVPTNATQTCNTRCQERYTDCTLACDGDLACAKSCAEQVGACVKECGENPAPKAKDPKAKDQKAKDPKAKDPKAKDPKAKDPKAKK
ncbi:MAG: hypothetical protein U0263_13340 [Polyangiaceae bacterium]